MCISGNANAAFEFKKRRKSFVEVKYHFFYCIRNKNDVSEDLWSLRFECLLMIEREWDTNIIGVSKQSPWSCKDDDGHLDKSAIRIRYLLYCVAAYKYRRVFLFYILYRVKLYKIALHFKVIWRVRIFKRSVNIFGSNFFGRWGKVDRSISRYSSLVSQSTTSLFLNCNPKVIWNARIYTWISTRIRN